MGGHFFLSRDDPVPADNGAILVISHVIKTVMTSAAEAELGTLYINAREAIYIRNILEAMGHPQPHTPVQTYNSTAETEANQGNEYAIPLASVSRGAEAFPFLLEARANKQR